MKHLSDKHPASLPRGTTGASSRRANPHLADLWKTAEALNLEHGIKRGAYVPWETIVVDDDLSPRFGEVDAHTVAAYMTVIDEIPPIHVQRGTYRLIDGRHRLTAARKTRDHVRIIEDDIPDEDLFMAAVAANLKHGLPLKIQHRLAIMRRFVADHVIGQETPWSAARVAAASGVDRVTANNYIRSVTDAGDAKAVVGIDGKTYPVARETAESAPEPILREKPSIRDGNPVGITSALQASATGDLMTEFGPEWRVGRSAERLAWKVWNVATGEALVLAGPVAVVALTEILNLVSAEMRRAGIV